MVWLSVFLAVFFVNPLKISAATSPTLTSSASYSVLGATTITCTGGATITGDIGVYAGSAITGFPVPCTVNPGTTQINTQSAIDAQADNLLAYGTLDQTCDYNYADGQDLTLLSPLGPGVYCSAGSFLLTKNLTLTGSGVWIFKTVSELTSSSGSSVTGGDPCNVWWRVGSSATLETTTSFIGNILSHTSIWVHTGASLNGRAMAYTGEVTLDNNAISGPTCADATPTPTNTPIPSNTPTGTPAPTNTPTNVPGPTNTPVSIAASTSIPISTEVLAQGPSPTRIVLPQTGLDFPLQALTIIGVIITLAGFLILL